MRVKIGTGQWRDEGPSRAVGGAAGVQRALGGRNVGDMIPGKSAGVTPQVRSDGGASKLGIKKLGG